MLKSVGIISLMLASSVMAQTGTLTEDKVVQLALERNELSAITKNQLEQAELGVKKARSYLYPKLTASAVFQKMYIVPEKNLPGGLQINQGNISLNQPLYTFGRLSSGVEIAKLDNELALNSVHGTRADITKAARQLFYNAVYSKSLLKIAQESVDNANKNKNALGERVSYGRINQNDNLKMQADVASRQPLLLEAKKIYESSMQDLSSFLNIERSELAEVSTHMTDLQFVTPTSKEVDHFIDVGAAEKRVRMAAAEKDLAKHDYMPTLSAFANYNPAHTTTNVSLPGVLLIDTAAFGLRLDLDLPLGGTKFQEAKIKTIEANSAELRLKNIKRETEKQQLSLIQQYQTLEEKGKTIDNAIKLAERAYKVALASFKNGSIGQLQLNDSEILLTQNKISYIQNLLQMKVLSSELERLQTQGGAQ